MAGQPHAASKHRRKHLRFVLVAGVCFVVVCFQHRIVVNVRSTIWQTTVPQTAASYSVLTDGEVEEGPQPLNHEIVEDPAVQWRRERHTYVNEWFQRPLVNESHIVGAADFEIDPHNRLRPHADDVKQGPILDFVIAGFGKCGTTSMVANLAAVYAPHMPVGDTCRPVHEIVQLAYTQWPSKWAVAAAAAADGTRTPSHNNITNSGTPSDAPFYRGYKCPSLLENVAEMSTVSRVLPQTKLIVGIRHPVRWFESFWNHQAVSQKRSYRTITPYNKTEPCTTNTTVCRNRCPGSLLCVHRSEFHVALAQLGKTALSTAAERQWLAADNPVYGGDRLGHQTVLNPIFLYDQTMLQQNETWDELASYLHLPDHGHELRHNRRVVANTRSDREHWRGRVNWIDICDAQWDDFRAYMMPIAYDLSHWLLEYFVPVAMNTSRPDVFIPNLSDFSRIVEHYRDDPCHRLERSYTDQGKVRYALPTAVRNSSDAGVAEADTNQ